MLDLLTASDPFLRDYESQLPLVASRTPEWVSTLRSNGLLSYQNAGIPTTRDEEYKYTSLRVLSETKFAYGFGANVVREELESSTLGKIDAITLVFVNGQFTPELSSTDSLPEGVFIGSLEDGFEVLPEVIEAHLGKIATFDGKLGTTNDNRFVDLSNAFLSEGAFVYLPRNSNLDRPVHVVSLSKATVGPQVVFPRLLVVLEENSEANLIESYIGLVGQVFNNAVVEISLGKSAQLEHNKFVGEGSHSIHISTTAVKQESKSVYTSNVANFGGSIIRNDINAWVGGEHCETWLNAANVATDHQVIDNHTRIDHALPNCQSFEVYKSILRDHGIGVFNGKIFVYEDAQKTDAKQTNQAILLSPTATMNTKPQLEIFADDVKCTHGATIGQLRDEAMFYLRARGIPKQEAQSLLVYAFAAEVLEKISIDSVREALEQALFQKLN